MYMKVLKFFLSSSLIIAMSLVTTVSFNAQAQVDNLKKELAKKQSKMAKDLVKRHEKEGWILANNDNTLEVAVLEHLIATTENKSKVGKITGEVSKCKSMNVGRMSALNNAQNLLSQQLSAQIQGCVRSLINANAEDVDAEIDEMVAGFDKKVKANLSGVLKESYSVYKENGDGTKQFRTFFLVDLDKCKAATNTALEKALKDTKVAIELADQIKDFVNNGLEISE